MNKRIFSKLIVLIVAFMCMINGILPTKTYAITTHKYNDLYYYGEKCEKSGEYVLWGSVAKPTINAIEGEIYSGPIKSFGSAGVRDIFYYDENNKACVPEIVGNGIVYLEEGVTYYYTASRYKHETSEAVPFVFLASLEEYPEYREMLENGQTLPVRYYNPGDAASLIESIISRALLVIGTVFYVLVKFVVGGDFSIEKIIFNEYDTTRLTFFNTGTKNVTIDSFINESGLSSVLNDFYSFFNGIAIAAYLIILVYMAIRIMLGSTAEKGSRYKELIVYWLEGVLILFLFPYVMKYSIQINDTFVTYIASGKEAFTSEIAMPIILSDEEHELKDIKEVTDKTTEELKKGTDFMSIMYAQAWEQGWLVYTICWLVMLFQMVGFLVVYFKRILIMMFLIAIFPLVMISYAIDKIGDAKSQAFSNWVKEFMLNVFMQSFHAMAYVLIMSTICLLMDNPSENRLLILIAISFISKGDDILRGIFSLTGKADTVKGIGRTIAETAAITGIAGSIRSVKAKFTGKDSAGRKFANQVRHVNQMAWNKAGNRVRMTAANIEKEKLSKDVPPPMPNIDAIPKEDIENNINKDLNILFDKNSSEDNIRHAIDRLGKYEDPNNSEDVKNAFANAKGKRSQEEQKLLENLLKQNAATKMLMQGGRQIDINEQVKIIISCLRRDANGNLTKESKAILNNIVNDESELELLNLKVKFNKDKVREKKEAEKRRKEQAENKISKTSIRGRSAAGGRKIADDSKSNTEYVMRNGKNEEKNRISKRANLPGTERAAEEIARKTSTNYSENKNEENKNKHWENVERTAKDNTTKKVQGHASDSRGSTNNSASNIERYTEKNINEEATKKSYLQNSSKNIGEEIANKKGTVEDLNVFVDNKYDEYVTEDIDKALNEALNENFEKITKGSEEATELFKKDLSDATNLVNMLRSSETGKYSAEELLNCVASLKDIINRNKNSGKSNEEALDNILKLLGVSLDDYESFIRIKILNDPDSVGNDREIIEESKEYYLKNKDTMPKLLKEKLAYNEADLREGNNLKYARRKNTKYNGVVSSKVQKEIEAKIRMRELENEIEKATAKDEEYSAKAFGAEAWKLTKAAAGTAVDVITTGVSVGVGVTSVGMTTTGKGETLSEATKDFFAGYQTADSTIDTIKETVKETYDDIKHIGVKEFNDDGPIKETKRKTRKKNDKK